MVNEFYWSLLPVSRALANRFCEWIIVSFFLPYAERKSLKFSKGIVSWFAMSHLCTAARNRPMLRSLLECAGKVARSCCLFAVNPTMLSNSFRGSGPASVCRRKTQANPSVTKPCNATTLLCFPLWKAPLTRPKFLLPWAVALEEFACTCGMYKFFDVGTS